MPERIRLNFANDRPAVAADDLFGLHDDNCKAKADNTGMKKMATGDAAVASVQIPDTRKAEPNTCSTEQKQSAFGKIRSPPGFKQKKGPATQRPDGVKTRT